jgi:hypothetical protein
MKSRTAIAQYEATVVLVVLSLSLAAIVYGGLRREASLSSSPVFINEETSVGGTPDIVRLEVNSSAATTVSSLSLDDSSSTSGTIAFDGSAYSTSISLCTMDKTTFFSVDASLAGTLEVATDGRAWISGTWGTAESVQAGWHEVMIQGGSTCSIILPGGEVVSGSDSSSPLVSTVPMEGGYTGTSFTLYVPSGGGAHSLLITSTGGFDHVGL